MKESKEMKAEGDADRETGGKCSAAWQYKILLARAIAEKDFLTKVSMNPICCMHKVCWDAHRAERGSKPLSNKTRLSCVE